MRFFSVLLFAGVFLSSFIFSTFLYAADPSQTGSYTPLDKLKRGALNTVTSPVEIGRQIHLTTEENSLLAGWTVGLVKGAGYGILRFGAGLADLLTFPFNWPDSKKAPLIEPEYVWEKPGPKYT